MSNVPRGLKNNNTGNIIKSPSFWQGEIEGTDGRFKTFKSMAYGYRAMFVLLRDYIAKGNNTLTTIIERYAPSFENATTSYISAVAKATGLKPDQEIGRADMDTLEKIVAAISKVENGINANLNDVREGRNLVSPSALKSAVA